MAFANTDGGEIIIGVEDDTTISWVPHGEEDIEAMLAAPETHVFQGQVLPIVYKLKVEIDGQVILFFQVEKGTTEIFQLQDGRVMRRNEKRQTVPANVKQLQFDRNEIRSREYDRQYVDGATTTDLDLHLVQELADRYLTGLTAERYLQQLGLAEYTTSGLRLTRAAVLLFAKDIQRWHPRSHVRFIKVNGDELYSGEAYNVISDEFAQGNIYELIYKSWEMLRPYLAYKTEFGADAKFEQRYVYPEAACEGMKRIFQLMRESELRTPELYSNSVWFTVTLFNQSVYSARQQQFLNQFSNYSLTTRQKNILVRGMDGKELSPEDIYIAMNIDDRDTYDKK